MSSWNNGINLPRLDSGAASPLSITLSGALATQVVSASAATSASPTVRSSLAYSATKGIGRIVTVTSTTSTAAYAVGAANAITVTGTDANGNAQTDTIALTLTNGNETLATVKAFATVSTINIPAMLTTGGTLAFATKDIVLGRPPRQIRVGTAGSGALHVGYNGDAGVIQDTITAVTAGEKLDISPNWLYIDSTVQDITLLF